MSLENWESYFKAEVRNAGQSYVVKGKVSLMHPSDTQLQAYVRASTAFKVFLKSPSIDSPLLEASCTCPQFRKGQLCKHIWATLIVATDKNLDFLNSKEHLQISPSPMETANARSAPTQKQLDSQAAYKTKQADYRKKQYQLQKERAQSFKKQKSSKQHPPPVFPQAVASALKYFAENGFDLQENLNTDAVLLARKKLSRIFHPDLGGSHDEIVTLNHNTEILLKELS